MGTNFYLFTQEKAKAEKWFACNEFELTDFPRFGYEAHIAKTSCGWLPLFQGHQMARSVAGIKRIFDDGGFSIIDEYGDSYDWEQFTERVLKFNSDDDDNPIRHSEYGDVSARMGIYIDPERYEFTDMEFS